MGKTDFAVSLDMLEGELPNLEAVADDAPDVVRFQMIADDRLRPYAPTAPDRHLWADDWDRPAHHVAALLDPRARRRRGPGSS